MLFQASPCGSGTLWPKERQRLNVGLKLFPANLSAIENLTHKQTADGYLRILVVNNGHQAEARNAADALIRLKHIQSLPLRIELVESSHMTDLQGESVAGIFVVTPNLDAALLKQWAQSNLTMVFSPFAGDVERGATAGLYVSDRILPYINLEQAEKAQVRFKPFFLKVARKHE